MRLCCSTPAGQHTGKQRTCARAQKHFILNSINRQGNNNQHTKMHTGPSICFPVTRQHNTSINTAMPGARKTGALHSVKAINDPDDLSNLPRNARCCTDRFTQPKMLYMKNLDWHRAAQCMTRMRVLYLSKLCCIQHHVLDDQPSKVLAPKTVSTCALAPKRKQDEAKHSTNPTTSAPQLQGLGKRWALVARPCQLHTALRASSCASSLTQAGHSPQLHILHPHRTNSEQSSAERGASASVLTKLAKHVTYRVPQQTAANAGHSEKPAMQPH